MELFVQNISYFNPTNRSASSNIDLVKTVSVFPIHFLQLLMHHTPLISHHFLLGRVISHLFASPAS